MEFLMCQPALQHPAVAALGSVVTSVLWDSGHKLSALTVSQNHSHGSNTKKKLRESANVAVSFKFGQSA